MPVAYSTVVAQSFATLAVEVVRHYIKSPRRCWTAMVWDILGPLVELLGTKLIEFAYQWACRVLDSYYVDGRGRMAATPGA